MVKSNDIALHCSRQNNLADVSARLSSPGYEESSEEDTDDEKGGNGYVTMLNKSTALPVESLKEYILQHSTDSHFKDEFSVRSYPGHIHQISLGSYTSHVHQFSLGSYTGHVHQFSLGSYTGHVHQSR